MDIITAIAKLEKKMSERELSDDGYYISRQYKEDCLALDRLQQQLKQTIEK